MRNEKEWVLEAEEISLRRDRRIVLQPLSFRAARGEHWVLLGPNGAGKSLLFHLLTGYLWPTTGRIRLLGQTLGTVDIRDLRRRLGWASRALEEMTPPESLVWEVVTSGLQATLGLYDHPGAGQIEEARAQAEAFGLGPLWERPFGLLSSGERQRALLARAALGRPELLFLDEPMSNLDLGGRELFLAHLARLAEAPDSPTIFLATHNTLEIGPFINRALMLADGTMVAAGPLAEVLTPEALSRAFGLPLVVEKTSGGRYLVRM